MTASSQLAVLALGLALVATGCRNDPPPNACTVDEGQCIDTCQGGKSCNDACDTCVLPDQPDLTLEEQSCFIHDEGQCLLDMCVLRAIENGLVTVNQVNALDDDELNTWFRCDQECKFCLPPDTTDATLPCQANMNIGGDLNCIDGCPEGQRCTTDCLQCIPIAQTLPCALEDGVCMDGCSQGMHCDRACQACTDTGFYGCQKNNEDQCQDFCPDGEACNDTCTGCETQPERNCQQLEGRCFDTCNADERCDEACAACIPYSPPPGCSVVNNRCVNNCGPGKRCNDACHTCTQ